MRPLEPESSDGRWIHPRSGATRRANPPRGARFRPSPRRRRDNAFVAELLEDRRLPSGFGLISLIAPPVPIPQAYALVREIASGGAVDRLAPSLASITGTISSDQRAAPQAAIAPLAGISPALATPKITLVGTPSSTAPAIGLGLGGGTPAATLASIVPVPNSGPRGEAPAAATPSGGGSVTTTGNALDRPGSVAIGLPLLEASSSPTGVIAGSSTAGATGPGNAPDVGKAVAPASVVANADRTEGVTSPGTGHGRGAGPAVQQTPPSAVARGTVASAGDAGIPESRRDRDTPPMSDPAPVDEDILAAPDVPPATPETPAELMPSDLEGLERALGQLLRGFDEMGEELAAWLSRADVLEMLLAAGAVGLAGVAIRRHLRRPRPAGDRAATSPWCSRLPGPLYLPRTCRPGSVTPTSSVWELRRRVV